MNKQKLSPEEEAVFEEIIKDGEKLMKEMEDFIEMLKRRNRISAIMFFVIIIIFAIWLIYILGWVI